MRSNDCSDTQERQALFLSKKMALMENCIFCKVVDGTAPSWKVWENDYVYAFLDINPVSRYHTLVIPKAHYVNIFDIDPIHLRELTAGVQHVCKLYQEKLGFNDIQIISNSGAAAQQTVFHLHFHIVPRSSTDMNDIRWRVHPEWRIDFDEMLEQLK